MMTRDAAPDDRNFGSNDGQRLKDAARCDNSHYGTRSHRATFLRVHSRLTDVFALSLASGPQKFCLRSKVGKYSAIVVFASQCEEAGSALGVEISSDMATVICHLSVFFCCKHRGLAREKPIRVRRARTFND